MYAAKEGGKDIVKLLLYAGADVNAKDNFGKTVSDYAREKKDWPSNDYPEIVTLLKKFQFNIDLELLTAAEKGDINKVKLLLEKKDINVSEKDEDGCTALMKAAKNGYGNIIELLLKNGADVDEMDDYSKSAFKWAVIKNQKNIIKLLIDKGCDKSRTIVAEELTRNAPLFVVGLSDWL